MIGEHLDVLPDVQSHFANVDFLVIFSATNTILVYQASSGRLMVSRLLVGSPIMK